MLHITTDGGSNGGGDSPTDIWYEYCIPILL